ncbi:PEP-CTERM sorting domain-containing protein [Pelomonas sp. KK5]|uniref:PEP-CTERM sorting domain-containing protein n=1 Tax=Pelomonas sp. KK5 TaxID=1855730 RepID=UPI00097C1D5D|nr:PEP-CTERM sorting domain-containing protein [Pelomonas sp. KK5]
MNKKTSALLLALGLAATGAASAQDIRYLSTDGMTITTSSTTAGYLTGGLEMVTSSGTSFEAFCVELAQGHATSAAGFQSYTVGSFSTAQSTLLQGLYSTSYATLSSPADKAAFQTAVWEIMQEPSGTALNVGTGDFQFYYLSATSTDTQDNAFAAQANAMLLAASNYTGSAQYTLTKLVSPTYQDFVTVTAVPEPESYAMMLAGLGVLAFVAGRRRPR